MQKLQSLKNYDFFYCIAETVIRINMRKRCKKQKDADKKVKTRWVGQIEFK